MEKWISNAGANSFNIIVYYRSFAGFSYFNFFHFSIDM